MQIDRVRAAQIGRETVNILQAGRYKTASGATVDIRDALKKAIHGTVSYSPKSPLPAVTPGNWGTDIQVRNETTLETARHLADLGLRVAALNFASATNPGGGFLGGARAQEESLARSSGLYPCIANDPMYDFHRSRHDPMYIDYVIYSPDVPVIRTDDGNLLDQPYLCSFLTSPAVNAKVVLERTPQRHTEIRAAMRSRIGKVLSVAALHRHDTLILGAWGCGAFGNNSSDVAEFFREALATRYKGVFALVIFAITDWSPNRRFIGPFEQAFGQMGQKKG
ncbi:MAG: TIGR02452 family protein [Anaerolineae bacterium]|nr:TIGR02452 family protein [Anaerolineae bacterium]